MSRNAHITCNNCSYGSYPFSLCKFPITSYGVIAYREKAGQIEYLLIRRKDSLGFVDFVRGKYRTTDQGYISNIIDEMSNEEKALLLTLPFSRLWHKLWGTERTSLYRGEEKNSASKFATLVGSNGQEKSVLYRLINQSSTNWCEPEWGFPKGRRNYHEKELDCALREFEEETGYTLHKSNVIRNLFPFHEIFTGSNLKSYKHSYYVANLSEKARTKGHQLSEVGDMGWFTFEEAMAKFRPYNYEKIEILRKVNNVISNYRISS